jgi:hypothetical protein
MLLLRRRGFVQFVYEPIKTLIECCMADNREQLWKLTDRLGVTPKLKSCVPSRAMRRNCGGISRRPQHSTCRTGQIF